MNNDEHKKEAERLIEVVTTQIEMIADKTGKISTFYLDSSMKIASITAQLAQVHATLATVSEPITNNTIFNGTVECERFSG